MKKHRSLKEHSRICSNIYLTGMGIIILTVLFENTSTKMGLLTIGVAVVVAAMVYRFKYIKCPHCGSNLVGSRILPEFCPDCGKTLEDSLE